MGLLGTIVPDSQILAQIVNGLEKEGENILFDLSNDYNGKYSEEPEKSAHTPDGKYIFKNEQCVIRYNDCNVSLYSFGSSGIRSEFHFEGSPYKIIVSMKKDLEKQIGIWPIGFLGRLIGLLSKKNMSYILNIK